MGSLGRHDNDWQAEQDAQPEVSGAVRQGIERQSQPSPIGQGRGGRPNKSGPDCTQFGTTRHELWWATESGCHSPFKRHACVANKRDPPVETDGSSWRTKRKRAPPKAAPGSFPPHAIECAAVLCLVSLALCRRVLLAHSATESDDSSFSRLEWFGQIPTERE